MPPKQVYGKRTKTSAAGYAKFLSPDKESVPAKPKTEPKHEISSSVDLDLNLEALTLQEKNNTRYATQKSGNDQVAKEKGDQVGTRGHADIPAPETPAQASRSTVKRRTTPAELDRQLEALTLKEEKIARPATNEHVKNQQDAAIKVDQTVDQDHADIPVLATPTQNGRHTAKKRIKPTSQPEMHLLLTPDLTPAPDNIYTDYVAPVLSISDLRRILPFEQWSSELEPHFEVTKIAEASFSEVYRLTTKSGRQEISNESVLKVVALKSPPNAPLPSECRAGERTRKAVDPARQAKRERADREKEDEWKSHVADVVSEVKLLQNLNHIPGFTHFCEATVLQGRPSALFANAWKSWNKSRPRGKKSEFPDPTKKTSYEDAQLWVVIEMQDAGTDCEKLMDAGGLGTIWEIWDVFWGVCLSVAKAEEACRFEHRDLHLENICIRSSRPGTDAMAPVIMNPLKRKLGSSGLETTVIDYTLSRADIVGSSHHDSRRTSSSSSTSCLSAPSTASTADSHQEIDIAYLDLNKSVGLFEGNAEDEYQYEIYRYMRSAVFHGDPLKQDTTEENDPAPYEYTPETPRRSPRKPKSTGSACAAGTPIYGGSLSRHNSANPSSDAKDDIWKRFHPKTNLVWAHFILHKLLEHMDGYEPANLSLEDIMANVRESREDAPKVQKKAMRLYRVLEKVAMMLEPSALGRHVSLGSMKELVVLAIEHRWLDVADVAGGDD
ncbi:hypothetical protein K505DRAFT_290148 [Melanomma pulvis-pyrius CBS 109.77]|uniref:non-specific serine/threonine protein kinase n=1 Tax=Melanomma pulvis-pyrius CBS 109.77 TaxID=1314802 RepID=A0A6A6WPY8_9PLEO|nr:hypothetical protein K505DRAFT_290148 [Melanomma pulvis-pyrius CBS 109.77]